eukprot:1139560-Pelagomonas_calceolata.AAC.5
MSAICSGWTCPIFQTSRTQVKKMPGTSWILAHLAQAVSVGFVEKHLIGFGVLLPADIHDLKCFPLEKSLARYTSKDIEAVMGSGSSSMWLKTRAMCARVSSSQVFELFNACVIMVNAIVLGLDWCVGPSVCSVQTPLHGFKAHWHANLAPTPSACLQLQVVQLSPKAAQRLWFRRYMMPETLEEAMFNMNLVFTIYFVVEFLIRITGQGPDLYFSSGMNWWVPGSLAAKLLFQLHLAPDPRQECNNKVGGEEYGLRDPCVQEVTIHQMPPNPADGCYFTDME